PISNCNIAVAWMHRARRLWKMRRAICLTPWCKWRRPGRDRVSRSPAWAVPLNGRKKRDTASGKTQYATCKNYGRDAESGGGGGQTGGGGRNHATIYEGGPPA